MFANLFQERIRIKLFNIEYPFTAPFAGKNHHSAKHCRYACGIGYSLSTGFLIGFLVAAVIPDVVSFFPAVFNPAYTAANRSLTSIVFTKFSRVGKYILQEFER